MRQLQSQVPWDRGRPPSDCLGPTPIGDELRQNAGGRLHGLEVYSFVVSVNVLTDRTVDQCGDVAVETEHARIQIPRVLPCGRLPLDNQSVSVSERGLCHGVLGENVALS